MAVKFYVQFVGLPGDNKFEISEQAVIGSEVGDIVLNVPTLSPRHCRVSVAGGVFTISDEGSSEGVFVNEQRIAPGKKVVLQEDDKVYLGSLEIQFTQEELSNEDQLLKDKLAELGLPPSDEEDVDDGPSEDPIEEVNFQEFRQFEKTENSNEAETVHFVPQDAANKQSILKKLFSKINFLKKNEEEKQEEIPDVPPVAEVEETDDFIRPFAKNIPFAANGWIRFVAILVDFLLAYALWMMFEEIELFKSFLNFIGEQLREVLMPLSEIFSTVLPAELSFQQFSQTHYYQLVVLYIMVRFLGVVACGVSFGQFMLGIHSNLAGRPSLNRAIGIWRACVGLITAPLLVFEFLSLFKKRTPKEFLSFTVLLPAAKWRSIAGGAISLVLMLSLAFVSPLLKGLEILRPIPFVDQQKMAPPTAEYASVPAISLYYSMSLQVPEANYLILPEFEIQQIEGKTTLFPSVLFSMKSGGGEVKFKKIGQIAWATLIEIALEGQLSTGEIYPKLSSRLEEMKNLNPNFKRKKMSKREILEWQNELISLLKVTFSLSLDPEILSTQVLKHGPILDGLIAFRHQLFRYVSPVKSPNAEILRLGSELFLKIIPSKEILPYREFLISLNPNNPYYYEFSFKGLNDFSHTYPYFYYPILGKVTYLEDVPKGEQAADTLPLTSAFSVVDYLSIDSMGKELDAQKSQEVFNFMFQVGKTLVMDQQSVGMDLYLSSLKHTAQLAEALQVPAEGEGTPHKVMAGQLMQLNEFMEKKDYSILESGFPPIMEGSSSQMETPISEEGQTAQENKTASVIEVQE